MLFRSLLLFIRAMWEHLSPINPDDFKGLIYFRDVVVLFPASFILVFTLLRYGNSTVSWFISTFPVKLVSLKLVQKKRRLLMFFMAFMIFCMCTLISIFVFKTSAHIVDEANYLFQGNVFAAGKLAASPPLLSKDFFEIQYLIQSSNNWYGSFFPGQSVLLAIGVLLKCPYLINPCLTAILLVTTVWAGRRILLHNRRIICGIFVALLSFCFVPRSQLLSTYFHSNSCNHHTCMAFKAQRATMVESIEVWYHDRRDLFV